MSEKRMRLWAGGIGAVLCTAAFIAGLIRDQPAVMLGSFLGVMLAGNVLPYSEIKHLLPWGRG